MSAIICPDWVCISLGKDTKAEFQATAKHNSSKQTYSIDLNGKLLIAMPGMSDPRFASSVIFMCAHSEDGAMGLIVNKPTKELQLAAYT